ncbi:MAG: ferredoxin, partial [Clostridia bacterium]|nr:ferredoxin [Clostridia bacterium]
KGKEHFLERVESRHGTHTIDVAEELGVGTKNYELVKLD